MKCAEKQSYTNFVAKEEYICDHREYISKILHDQSVQFSFFTNNRKPGRFEIESI